MKLLYILTVALSQSNPFAWKIIKIAISAAGILPISQRAHLAATVGTLEEQSLKIGGIIPFLKFITAKPENSRKYDKVKGFVRKNTKNCNFR